MMLETVHYPDEPPVTYQPNGDRAILEALKYALGLTIREVYPMAQKILIDSLDPIQADGPIFTFDGVLAVPGPRDKVNLIEVRDECARQIKTCQMLLECGENEIEAARVVLHNSIHWMRFYSVRAPTEELREMFAKGLKRLTTGMEDGDG